MKDNWLTVEEAAERLGYSSKSSVWNHAKKKTPGFPRPYALGPKNTKWKESEVAAYVESRRVE
jgi:predicted DNA-binding transcriptional regulator AlpA